MPSVELAHLRSVRCEAEWGGTLGIARVERAALAAPFLPVLGVTDPEVSKGGSLA
jgi:hypothetical protein